jgi:hypothetical protein
LLLGETLNWQVLISFIRQSLFDGDFWEDWVGKKTKYFGRRDYYFGARILAD